MAKRVKQPVGLWLFKQEPSSYSFNQLLADSETIWDGVSNNLARQNLWKVVLGDRVLYYHTGNEKAVVGEAVVTAAPHVPETSEDPKAVVVQIRAVQSWPKPVPLARIKQVAELADWELVRLPRLSILPVNAQQWNILEKLSRE